MSAELGDPKSLGDVPIGGLRPGPRGGMLRRGNPDHTGGRARQDFRQMARDLMRDPSVEAAVRRILTDPENRNFASLWKHVAERAFGPVVQKVKVKGQHEVRGVILLPQQSWGAPAVSPAASELAPDARALPAGPVALPAAALPLPPALLDAMADAVAAAAIAAANADDSERAP